MVGQSPVSSLAKGLAQLGLMNFALPQSPVGWRLADWGGGGQRGQKTGLT